MRIIPALAAISVALSQQLVAGGTAASRAAALVAQMTLDEKISMLHGSDPGPYSGTTAANPRLGIPSLTLNDGPQGYRSPGYPGTSTAFPCALAAAATFDKALAGKFGDAMGLEFRSKGSNVQLGPGVNVARVPNNGRNFEYASGEDPFLGSVIAGAIVKGIQARGVIATVKHFLHNNQETDRGGVNAVVDERTMMEIYAPPFEAAVEDAKAGAVMCSYNRITASTYTTTANATWACENPDTLQRVLKEGFGFDGFVVSDWGATHSTVAAALGGLDMEMDGDDHFGDPLREAVVSGKVPEAAVDAMAARVLTPMFRLGIMDSSGGSGAVGGLARAGSAKEGSAKEGSANEGSANEGSAALHPVAWGKASANVTSTAHARLARTLAAASYVLLKNDPVAGSLGAGDGRGGPLLPLPLHRPIKVVVVGPGAQDAPITTSLDPSDSGEVDGPYVVTGLAGIVEACAAAPGSSVAYVNATDGAGAVHLPLSSADASLVASADAAVVFVGTTSREGVDRASLGLDGGQDDLVAAVAGLNPRTVAVVAAPGAVLVGGWVDAVPAVLVTWLPGQEGGHATADVLFGAANPSGRLPLTFPRVENEVGEGVRVGG